MASVNRVTLLGNLTKDPEVKTTTNGQVVANLGLATSEKFKDKQGASKEKTEWHSLVAWGKNAEILGEYAKKGQPLYVEGRLETRSWEKDGVKHYKTEINVSSFQLLGKKSDGEAKQASGEEDIPF